MRFHQSTASRLARVTGAAALLAGVFAIAPVTVSSAGDGGTKDIKIRDECDPVTFNAILGEGTCVGDGDVTFEEVIATLNPDDFGHDKWRQPEKVDIKASRALRATNRGGETHTFTEVANFGPGFVEELNGVFAPGTPHAVPVSAELNFVPPGGNVTVSGLSPGTHLFMCMIHPWMQTTVKVKKG